MFCDVCRLIPGSVISSSSVAVLIFRRSLPKQIASASGKLNAALRLRRWPPFTPLGIREWFSLQRFGFCGRMQQPYRGSGRLCGTPIPTLTLLLTCAQRLITGTWILCIETQGRLWYRLIERISCKEKPSSYSSSPSSYNTNIKCKVTTWLMWTLVIIIKLPQWSFRFLKQCPETMIILFYYY